MDITKPTVQRQGERLIMPGLATAHSHAFQRALRGRTQRRATQAGSFWSWRGLMYSLVEKLEPEDVFNLSRFAYTELAMSGVTAVGEFHYLHHAPGGDPYANRLAMAEAVIEAARAVGVRITLIRTVYLRAGHGQALAPAQQRFADIALAPIFQDVETLMQRFAGDPLVRVALAAHSIRAVPLDQVVELAAFAEAHDLPFHMHLAEQRREIEECWQEYGRRPVDLLAEAGVLGPRFVAVHATHLTEAEIAALGRAGTFVCLCRTTERDLGDGLPRTRDLVQAGVKLCVGVDSHAGSDAFEEIRAVELDDRSRTEARHVVAEAAGLLEMATSHGYQAIGFGQAGQADRVSLNADDASLAGAADDLLSEAVIFGATPRAVEEVLIEGRTIVRAGIHVEYEEARRGYLAALRNLRLA